MTRHTIKEIAQTLDVSPADALELVRKAGITAFCHEGQELTEAIQLEAYLTKHWQFDATPALDFEATPAQLAAILEPEISQCISDLKVEAINNDSISSYSPNLRRAGGRCRLHHFRLGCWHQANRRGR